MQVKTKLPVCTGNVSLDGKYFVFTLTEKRIGISKKIRKKEERERLNSLVKNIQMKTTASLYVRMQQGLQKKY